METSFSFVLSDSAVVSSYRTYEEWKHFTHRCARIGAFVLTVPMRNGNFLCECNFHVIFKVLTVPMRNGNLGSHPHLFVHLFVLTVPMRNGNLHKNIEYTTDSKVLTVPMRNGNVSE